MSGIIHSKGGTMRIPAADIEVYDKDFCGLWAVTANGLGDVVLEAPRNSDDILVDWLGRFLIRMKLEPGWTPPLDMIDIQSDPLEGVKR